MMVHIYKDAEEACESMAAWISDHIHHTLLVKDRFTWALAGGGTPKKLYKLLAAPPYNKKIKWDRVHIFWGDERFVPFGDERNNAKMAYENLLSQVDLPSQNIHRISTDVAPENSAMLYEKTLHQYFDDEQTSFDLVLLGMGEDGHTLSLFPGDEILKDKNKWVSAVTSKEKGERITLMPAIVNRSAAIAFLVTGAGKAKVVQQVIETPHLHSHPAQLIQPLDTEPHWFLDEKAAKYLKV